MEKKINIPKKGAAKKWANILKEMGKRPPPKDLVDKINNGDKKKIATPQTEPRDLDLE